MGCTVTKQEIKANHTHSSPRKIEIEEASEASHTHDIYDQLKTNPNAYFLNRNHKRCFKRHQQDSLTPTSLTLSVQTTPSEPPAILTLAY